MRFYQVLEDPHLAMAEAVHSKFKLSWMMEERRAATLHLLKKRAVFWKHFAMKIQQPVTEATKTTHFFHLLQASPSSAEVQQWVNDRGTDLSELMKFPKVKKIFNQRNTGIPPSAPAERLFSKGRDVFSIKTGKLADANFEKQLILNYNEFCK